MANGFHLGTQRWGVPYDIWDRIDWLRAQGRQHFSHVIFIGGRRAGKGHLGALMVAYEWYRLLLLGDPQAHYGLAKGKHLRTQIMATTYIQARDNVFADLFALVTNAACFKGRIVTNKRHLTLVTPADELRLAALGGGDAALRREFASLRAQAISSTASGSRGATNTFLALDEFAHHPEAASGKPKAEEVYRALAPTVDQMRGDGMIYIPTSPWTVESYAHKLYLDGIEVDEAGHPTNPDFLVIQLPSWAPYMDWDDTTATEGRLFVSAPGRGPPASEAAGPYLVGVEYEAQWGAVEASYLALDVVDRMFEPFCPTCGKTLGDATSCQQCEAAPASSIRRSSEAWSSATRATPILESRNRTLRSPSLTLRSWESKGVSNSPM